ncbi:hypothetical protein, partial [Streptomyces sp. CBMA370]|nr:hypothetical protein [Streptomyces sp. CBMA370]
MSCPEATGAAEATAALEDATRRLRAVLDAPEAAETRPAGAGPAGADARRASLDEELCDRLIDLAAARAWAADRATARDPAAGVLRG